MCLILEFSPKWNQTDPILSMFSAEFQHSDLTTCVPFEEMLNQLQHVTRKTSHRFHRHLFFLIQSMTFVINSNNEANTNYYKSITHPSSLSMAKLMTWLKLEPWENQVTKDVSKQLQSLLSLLLLSKIQ